jgi:hypothetical protein
MSEKVQICGSAESLVKKRNKGISEPEPPKTFGGLEIKDRRQPLLIET